MRKREQIDLDVGGVVMVEVVTVEDSISKSASNARQSAAEFFAEQKFESRRDK